jgi:hypothetical protein
MSIRLCVTPPVKALTLPDSFGSTSNVDEPFRFFVQFDSFLGDFVF